MKKFISIFLALIFSVCLVGCGEDNASEPYMNSDKGNNSDNMMSDFNSMLDNSTNIDSTQNNQIISDTEAKITKEKAKETALNHAKLKESDIKNYKINLDRDDGTLKYEISFDANGTEYDYDIDATSGEIIKTDKETID